VCIVVANSIMYVRVLPYTVNVILLDTILVVTVVSVEVRREQQTKAGNIGRRISDFIGTDRFPTESAAAAVVVVQPKR